MHVILSACNMRTTITLFCYLQDPLLYLSISIFYLLKYFKPVVNFVVMFMKFQEVKEILLVQKSQRDCLHRL